MQDPNIGQRDTVKQVFNSLDFIVVFGDSNV
jgi:hypothetical protein